MRKTQKLVVGSTATRPAPFAALMGQPAHLGKVVVAGSAVMQVPPAVLIKKVAASLRKSVVREHVRSVSLLTDNATWKG